MTGWTYGIGATAAKDLRKRNPTAVPIESDDKLRELLVEGRITVVTLDTNAFDGQKLNFNSAALKATGSLKVVPFSFLLSNTVVREVTRHVAKAMEDALRDLKKAAGLALYAFDIASPTRSELLERITGRHSIESQASARVQDFLNNSGCDVLDDASLVDVATIFGAYFDHCPPFSHGKKSEFPDALALYALDNAATQRDTGFLVVSEDGDWRAFCEKSKYLYLVPKIEKALSLINDAPVMLRSVVVSWFAEGQGGRGEVGAEITHHVEHQDVNAIAYPTSGEIEAHAWATEVQHIEWPDEALIDIIETEETKDGKYRVVVSMPVILELRFSIELSFSIWDSVDRESVGMGGRTVEVDRVEDTRLTVILELISVGGEDEEVELVETELDITFLEVDLGEVDVFEPEDYDE